MSLWIDDPDQSYNQKEIIPNKMQRYSSTKEYLEIHYRLLLEDFIYALRSDLAALKGISSGKVWTVLYYLGIDWISFISYTNCNGQNLKAEF